MEKVIAFVSLGCAKNQVNCEQMMYLLSEAGYEIRAAEPPETVEADAVIINTCGFIESAKAEAIDSILSYGAAKAEGRIRKLVATGCLTQRYCGEILAELPELDGAVGTGSYGEIADVMARVFSGERVGEYGDIDAPDLESGRVLSSMNAWAYLKIAEGCDNRCAYCVIPDIRGRYRSRPMENILAEAQGLAGQGIRELIVVAQDITRYGTDLYCRRMLAELLKKLCRMDFDWIRLHYLYPDEVDDELIDVIAGEEKILKYLDIPIQHINNGILRAMRRRGTAEEIKALFKKLRERIPGLVLRTSLITGLPGEGEEEFRELLDFLREARIERAGAFAYSPEEGTDAERMERPSAEIAEARAARVELLQQEIMSAFNRSRIGKPVRVLCEDFDGEYWYGRSYAESPDIDGSIAFTGEGLILGEFYTVTIIGERADGIPLGEVEK